MTEKVLMKGNEVIAEAAVIAGCRHYFGYPITPQSELPAYLSKRLPDVGGVFLQAESEVAAINMVYGAAGCGVRVMTSSSSPGISLKLEGISYLAGAELPALIVNINREGPGLGNIQPSQCDYFQSVKGGGHGNYRLIVLAPHSVQEMAEHTALSFELAEKYKNPVLLLGDGTLGQMMEPVDLSKIKKVNPEDLKTPEWAIRGGKERVVISSINLLPEDMERHNIHLKEKYDLISENEVRYEDYFCEDAEIILVAFGISARVCKTAIEKARKRGVKVGLLRPITLWPFPSKIIAELAKTAKVFLTVEMNTGQMVEDVRLAVNGVKDVHHYGRVGGFVPAPFDVLQEITKLNAQYNS